MCARACKVSETGFAFSGNLWDVFLCATIRIWKRLWTQQHWWSSPGELYNSSCCFGAILFTFLIFGIERDSSNLAKIVPDSLLGRFDFGGAASAKMHTSTLDWWFTETHRTLSGTGVVIVSNRETSSFIWGSQSVSPWWSRTSISVSMFGVAAKVLFTLVRRGCHKAFLDGTIQPKVRIGKDTPDNDSDQWAKEGKGDEIQHVVNPSGED